jgi:hypothetical protein
MGLQAAVLSVHWQDMMNADAGMTIMKKEEPLMGAPGRRSTAKVARAEAT